MASKFKIDLPEGIDSTNTLGIPQIVEWSVSRCIRCAHFNGKGKGTCKAYPNGIPERFYVSVNQKKPDDHFQVEKDQTGSFVWEFK